ncbi:N-acetyltransferase family protein [Rufibacter glacialis]|uniref:GNAT family N-acetyltransferase n=1 Tax=Rufibacter glacialis TaxID=1259555 RepID=A0A5M8QR83_9BACT|nr:GNAT family N-acetyltransferase [Rufibacter glacialis]KAA6437560.1 GNAT family N-acetyltransferase [Rufibacter glacialis]
MSITVRAIEEKDNQALASLIREVFREFGIDRPGTVYTDPTTDQLFQLFQTPGSAYLVALENGKIIGGCGVYPTQGLPAGCAELVKFYLAAETRGRGIGLQLLEKNFEIARALGYTHLYLESFPELAQAVRMYTRAGFQPLPHALGNSGHYACTIWMQKDLREKAEEIEVK